MLDKINTVLSNIHLCDSSQDLKATTVIYQIITLTDISTITVVILLLLLLLPLPPPPPPPLLLRLVLLIVN